MDIKHQKIYTEKTISKDMGNFFPDVDIFGGMWMVVLRER